jgi:hypothetical protein
VKWPRIAIPLSFLLASYAQAFAQQITRIQIKTVYIGFAAHAEEEITIEKRNRHYYSQTKMVSDTAVCALLQAVNSRIIENLDLQNLGLTQEWVNQNANPALSDYVNKQRRTLSVEQKKHFLTTFTNLRIMTKLVDDYYASIWTDDHADIQIVVQTDEGKVIEISSDSQHEFMLPWRVSSVGPGTYWTWDANFSRAIAQLLPKNFPNRERIAGLCFRQVLSGMVIGNSAICDVPRREKTRGHDMPPTIGKPPRSH